MIGVIEYEKHGTGNPKCVNNKTTFESFCSVYLCSRRECQNGTERLTSSFFVTREVQA